MKKIGNSFKGIFGGFILIFISVIILWWNEGNNVRNIKTTKEMGANVIDVSSDEINNTNEGKLIATNGKIINEETHTDSTFSVSVKTPILKRIVEVYQWEEKEETDSDGNKTYTYDKVWSSKLIDSSTFHDSSYENPLSKRYQDETFKSKNVGLGAFVLSSSQIDSLSLNGKFTEIDDDAISSLGLNVYNGYIVSSSNFDNPSVGDIRISFIYNDSTDISVLAVQSGNTFKDYVSSQGKSINRVMDGIHSGKDMITIIENENKIIKWALRIVGIILSIAGVASILKPISTIASFVPVLGNLVNSAVMLVSTVIGLIISLIVIAIAWIRFRPIIGIVLLVIVVGLIVLLIKMKKSKSTNQETINNEVMQNTTVYQQPQPVEQTQVQSEPVVQPITQQPTQQVIDNPDYNNQNNQRM